MAQEFDPTSGFSEPASYRFLSLPDDHKIMVIADFCTLNAITEQYFEEALINVNPWLDKVFNPEGILDGYYLPDSLQWLQVCSHARHHFILANPENE